MRARCTPSAPEQPLPPLTGPFAATRRHLGKNKQNDIDIL
jgi:hypothetical protein